MSRKFSWLLLVAGLATSIGLTGCFMTGSNPGGANPPITHQEVQVADNGPRATVRMQVKVVPDITNPHRAKVVLGAYPSQRADVTGTDTGILTGTGTAIDTDTALGTDVLTGSGVVTLTGSGTAIATQAFVTGHLVSIYGPTANPPLATMTQRVPVTEEGIAELVFTDVPTKPTLAHLIIENGAIPDTTVNPPVYYSEFHGAFELVPGENVIVVHPVGSRFRRDIIAHVLKHVLRTPELWAKAPSHLIEAIEANVAYVDRGGETAYADAIAKVVDAFNRSWNVTLTIASPAANAEFIDGDNVTIATELADPDTNVERLEYYVDNTLLGTVFVEPGEATHSVTLASATIGRYLAKVLAFNKEGDMVATATEVPFVVNKPADPPAPPTIAFARPLDNATFSLVTGIDLEVVASDSLNWIQKVQFFQGETLLGESTTAPYTWRWGMGADQTDTWPPNAADLIVTGQYAFSAVAISTLDEVVATAPTVTITVEPPPAWNGTAEFTTTDDFLQGTVIGLDLSNPNEMKLSSNSTTLPFIWVPNTSEGTLSKLDSVTGRELGRYRLGRSSCSPSRTTVDLMGNCWVGNRNDGTVVKVGLLEAGQWIDRNQNGVCDTSRDLNENGTIDANEILPFGQDECVLLEVVVIDGKLGPYTPGTYTGGYSGTPGPRGIAIDRSNNVWAGCNGNRKYHYINGETGAIIKTITLSQSHYPYGAVVDRNGFLWSGSLGGSHPVIKIDPTTDAVTTVAVPHSVYGINADRFGNVWVTSWYDAKISRISVTTNQVTKTATGIGGQRGLAITDDGDVWTADSGQTTVTRYDRDGNKKASINVGDNPAGVSVDAAGKVWAVCLGGKVARIDPATNQVEFQKSFGGQHYAYSDMTGIVCRSTTTRTGTWTVVRDTGVNATAPLWNGTVVQWDATVPASTSISIRVRSSVDDTNWAPWETATNGGALSSTPAGRYLQVEAVFAIYAGEVSPVLRDLRLTAP